MSEQRSISNIKTQLAELSAMLADSQAVITPAERKRIEETIVQLQGKVTSRDEPAARPSFSFQPILDFLESAREILVGYNALVEALRDNQDLPNYRLWEIAQRLLPEEPFDSEANYPDESLFVGDVPPAVAGVEANTTHYAVYYLARHTLSKMLDAFATVTPLPAALSRDRYGGSPADRHVVSPDFKRALHNLFRQRTEVGAALRNLRLEPIDESDVLRRLRVESLRADRVRTVSPPLYSPPRAETDYEETAPTCVSPNPPALDRSTGRSRSPGRRA